MFLHFLHLCLQFKENYLSQRLQAETEMISLRLAFDHINHASYTSFQHVNLRMLEIHRNPASTELSEKGFGGSFNR